MKRFVRYVAGELIRAFVFFLLVALTAFFLTGSDIGFIYTAF